MDATNVQIALPMRRKIYLTAFSMFLLSSLFLIACVEPVTNNGIDNDTDLINDTANETNDEIINVYSISESMNDSNTSLRQHKNN